MKKLKNVGNIGGFVNIEEIQEHYEVCRSKSDGNCSEKRIFKASQLLCFQADEQMDSGGKVVEIRDFY